jgi:hypothetical protein
MLCAAMPMAAIYTAIAPPSAEQLVALARDNESKMYGANRRTVGRLAIAALVAAVAPPSHAAFAKTVLDRDLWGFLTPAATRGNHAAALQRVHEDLAVPSPLWPSSTELACLVGAAPAHYIGNNLIMLPPELVRAGSAAFAELEADHEPAAFLNEFFRSAAARGDALLLHWDFR